MQRNLGPRLLRLDRLDLNLLVALDTLIERRSVTAAATQLCLSQSAMSGALNRLREYFADPLLVPVGRTMKLTEKAEQLAGPIKEALLFIRTNIITAPEFNPATSERSFSLIASDYAYTVLLGPLLGRLEQLAPKARFRILPPGEEAFEKFAKGELDLILTLAITAIPGLRRKHLYDDENVIIHWNENRFIKDSLDARTFLQLDHAIVSYGPDRHPAIAEVEYAKANIQRNVTVWVPSFSALAEAVVGTQRVATVYRRLAEKFAKAYPISIAATPFKLPPIAEIIQWQAINDRNTGLQWLISQIVDAAERL